MAVNAIPKPFVDNDSVLAFEMASRRNVEVQPKNLITEYGNRSYTMNSSLASASFTRLLVYVT